MGDEVRSHLPLFLAPNPYPFLKRSPGVRLLTQWFLARPTLRAPGSHCTPLLYVPAHDMNFYRVQYLSPKTDGWCWLERVMIYPVLMSEMYLFIIVFENNQKVSLHKGTNRTKTGAVRFSSEMHCAMRIKERRACVGL